MPKKIAFEFLDGSVAIKEYLNSFAMVEGVPVTIIKKTTQYWRNMKASKIKLNLVCSSPTSVSQGYFLPHKQLYKNTLKGIHGNSK
ncbi:hypothetical protein Smp_096050 [Schistosoma mansoni]|uniref:Phage protein n=1 Tax=Schistosoma mansoni TaxID=6183 RepID=G4M0M1_SCHMA|nr:hypothetical protein Smp_096050 [Schistosoma mansoni]|eukprot:XP_018647038.1 hypothetical protein Smp_096050 [Schistosoma mansoni]